MTKTSEMIESELKGFIRSQEKLGGIKVDKLGHDATVLVETGTYIYQIMVDKYSFKEPRYIVDVSSPVCRAMGTILTGIDACSTRLKFTMKNWIGKGMSLRLHFQNGKSIVTGPVKGVTLVGKSKLGTEFHYEFWD